MATYSSTRKTLIVPDSSSPKIFQYNGGDGDVYINSSILRSGTDSSIEVEPINNSFVIYFDSSTRVAIKSNEDDFIYEPSDTNDTKNLMKYKRLNMMIDDDTSYTVLRVNPKLTGNVKVVVDSSSNLYLDTFKVSLGLSQNKYRHISINPSEYYGRTLMAKMKSMPVDDFYKIEDTCYDLFAIANDLDEQYYDTYNYGVRTNTDKMYKENYSLLAPLCIRKVLPDFFLIFKVNNYESLYKTDNNSINIKDRTSFIDLNNCELIKSFDFRKGTNLGTYIRTILKYNENFVGDVYTGYDYDHFNIYNGISVNSGVVTSIYEETSPERYVNNQVSMNDWYTLGFQRNHIVSKDIVNFEFMFDDTSDPLFSLSTYFGLYVRLNGEDETFTCIDIDSSSNCVFDKNIHGDDFDPTQYTKIIYGISTPDSFIRLKNNIRVSEETKKHKLEIYKNIITVNTFDINDFTNKWCYVSNVLNDVLDPGEHYRLIIPESKIIYEVVVSNYSDDNELSDISYHTETIYSNQEENEKDDWNIYRISIFNTEYRSNVDEEDKPEIIKNQLDLITKAFEKFNDSNIKAYNDGESSFSVLYKSYNNNDNNGDVITFEKVSSICGFNKTNDDIITDTNNEFVDESSYLFGLDNIPKIIIDPKIDDFESSELRRFYPIGFESLGTRVCCCVSLNNITYNSNNKPYTVLIDENIQKKLSNYKTVLYKNNNNENKIFNKNINVTYFKVEDKNIILSNTDNVYNIVGFGPKKSYVTQFEKNNKPQINSNNKIQFYQNYPMNSGICSIFQIKDYDFDVLDHNSIFFIQNENDDTESVRIDGDYSEYSSDNNVYGKYIIDKKQSEEFIADYCDKFKTYNIDSSLGYMKLDSDNNLGLFLSNMQKNGHNKFDVSLISPYCCKWRLLGTDMTGNRMRVMYYLNNPERKIITYDASTWVNGYITEKPIGEEIEEDDSYTTTSLIDITQYKDIYINSSTKKNIYAIGYYYSGGTMPTVESFSNKVFLEFNENYLKDCISIRITLSKANLNYDDVYISLSYKIDNVPFLSRDVNSYWIANNNDDHIGYLSSSLADDNFSKYISNLYDEEESGSFNKYIHTGEGSIDDLLYRYKNYINKFSKIYKHGDNSIEFVSCGIKIRIKSTDKSIINLSRYVGYSVIVIAMSGNNASQPGTYELFIDETKEQIAFIIYNGIYSVYNIINNNNINNNGTYRIKHSEKLTDIKYYTTQKVYVDDDGFLLDCSTGLEDSKIFIISKPTSDIDIIESVDKKQIILTGNVEKIDKDGILLKDTTYAVLGEIKKVYDQEAIKELINTNNNVDAYIITNHNSSVATYSLSINNLKQLTSSYAITIKTKNGTKKHNNISSILNIDIVDPFEIQRENPNYEIITKGYVHPSYAVPVMKDILNFTYKINDDICEKFETSFDGCNIMISDVNTINQTWMKKVIDIDNIMKQENDETSTTSNEPPVKYTITQIPLDGDYYVKDCSTNSIYTQNNYKFSIERVYNKQKIQECKIANNELVVEPSKVYKTWKNDEITIDYGKNIEETNLKDEDEKYNGVMYISYNETLQPNETLYYSTETLVGKIDSSLSIYLENLKYDSPIIGELQNERYTFYYDGKNNINDGIELYLRTNDNISNVENIEDFEFRISDSVITFSIDAPTYEKDGKSNLIHFTINENITRYKKANIDLKSNNTYAELEYEGTLEDSDLNTINYTEAQKNSSSKPTISKYINQSSSVTLLKKHDPLIGYWYTKMCRLFSKYDTYISYYGAFSGFEKNNYIASRGINMKTKDEDGNIINGCIISIWDDSIIDPDKRTISLNITSSLINFINDGANTGYSESWNKNQSYLDNMYNDYKTKYIENTILKLIDINNNTKFILYVDRSVDELIFNTDKRKIDTTKFEEVSNLKNTLVFSENRYYMNIENLEPHSYYAEMIINF